MEGFSSIKISHGYGFKIVDENVSFPNAVLLQKSLPALFESIENKSGNNQTDLLVNTILDMMV
jgi:hypothetical protein